MALDTTPHISVPGSMDMQLLEGLSWFRGSSVRIRRAGLEVHVDPRGVPDTGTADYILLTHPHYDNFSEDDIHRLRTPDTVVIAPVGMKKQLGDVDHFLRPGDMLQLRGLDVLALPAYNEDRHFHPAESGWLGYVFTVGGVTYYHAGDTDPIEAISAVRCNVAFLPVDERYTMGPSGAAEAARACSADVVVPIHWPDSSQDRSPAEELTRILPDKVRIIEPEG
ncbi:MAG: MBL fold metallo-hydrolase [Gemmatimonadales bacterium]|nr:MAG: MBL fold metallo-hydrolase [Gemmatimonadales bacterium]